MALFYSAANGGFYDETIHGARNLRIPDPAWSRPLINVTLAPGEEYFDGVQIVKNTGTEPMVLSNVPDWSAQHPAVDVPNPDCAVPVDGVEISRTLHAQLMAGQAEGFRIVPGEGGMPVLEEVVETFDQAKARVLQLAKAQRTPIMSVLDGMQATANALALKAWIADDIVTRDEQMAWANTLHDAKQALKDITKMDLSDCADFAAMQTKLINTYRAWVQANPGLAIAFREVTS